MRCRVAALALLSCIQTVAAQEAPYLDDRSTASQLIRSFYNAVNRKEYARAWGYYGDSKPTASLDAFAKGYADTDHVDAMVGIVTADGAAGSTYYSIPVAIQAYDTKGNSRVFAGCYTARLANPAIQADAFQSMHLEKGTLKPTDKGLANALPAKCEDGQPVADADPVVALAKQAYALANRRLCTNAQTSNGLPPDEPKSYPIKYRDQDDGSGAADQTARLVVFECSSGAYNTTQIYYLYNDDDGLRQLELPVPVIDVKYVTPGDNSKVESLTVTGFSGQPVVSNSSYDPGTKAIVSLEKWRGTGDASSSGKWVFQNGNFVLKHYELDASYDNQINPQAVIDY